MTADEKYMREAIKRGRIKGNHREQQNDKNQRCTRDLLDHGDNHSIEITVFGIPRDKIRFSRHLHPHRFISQDDKA